jgi:hypothetical protein
MANFYYVMSGGLKSAASGEGASSTVSKDNAPDWIVAKCWPATSAGIQNAMRTLITDGSDGDSLVFDTGTTSISAQSTTGNRHKTFFIEGRTAAAIVENTSATSTIFNINGNAAGVHVNDITFRDITLKQTGTFTGTLGCLVAAGFDTAAIRFHEGCVLTCDTITRTATLADGGLINNTGITAGRVFQFRGASISGGTLTTGSTGTFPTSFVLGTADSLLDIDGLDIDGITISNNVATSGVTSQIFNIVKQPTQVKGVTTSSITLNGIGAGFVRGFCSYNDNAAAMTISDSVFDGITMDGGTTAELQAWGGNAINDAEIIFTDCTSDGCSKANAVNAVGGMGLSLGASTVSTRSKVTFNNCHTTDAQGAFGAGGYGTGGGDIVVAVGTVTDSSDGGHVTAFNEPNGIAYYKGGTGDMLLEDFGSVRAVSAGTEQGQALYSHNNPNSPGTLARACTTTWRRGSVTGITNTLGNPSANLQNVEGAAPLDVRDHDCLLENMVFNNDGVEELTLRAAGSTSVQAVLNVVINDTQIKGYTGPADMALTGITTTTSFGSLNVIVTAGALVNLTLTNVTDTVAPTLTTPYSDQTLTVGDTYGPVDATTNFSGATSYIANGYPDGVDSSDPTNITGTVVRAGPSYPAVDAFNSFSTGSGSGSNHFTITVNPKELTLSETAIQPVANATTFQLKKEDGHNIMGSGFAHNFVGVRFYSDAGGTTEVPITGTAVVQVETLEAPLDEISSEGDSGQRWSFAGNPIGANIVFTGGNVAHFFKVFARQNKT